MTYLESDEEIREAIQAQQAKRAAPAPAGAPPQPPAAAAKAIDADVRAERPQDRPPMALLCILDDGRADGELVRLRADRCVIGRTEGDVVIPHDGMISGRHAEIVRQKTPAGYRWTLNDLGSTNGTFVRVGRTVLHPQAEIIVGRGRYRFEAGTVEQAPQATAAATVGWGGSAPPSHLAALVEITPAGPGQRYPLGTGEQWIGRDAKACQVARPDDPLVNARHARLYPDARGLWHVENNKSVNGLWLRVEQIPLTATCRFRLGEQRFLFRIL
jgi:pSer/pThr/pTyr-binding forkhead associated (FHA) protein